MTMPTMTSLRLAALDQLSKSIEDRLYKAGRDGLTISEIAEGLLFAVSTVRDRLILLQQTGRVYRERHTQPGRTAIFYTWHAAVFATQDVDADGPRRIITRSYPQNNSRDPLVSALFGPARKEAAHA